MDYHHRKLRLNTHEAAQYLGVKPGTMEVWRSKGKGPRYVKLGSRVVYETDDLDAYATSRIVETIDTVACAEWGNHD